MISRTQHSIQERETRSRAAQLLANQPFLRGNLVLRYRSCGKSYCRCQRGQRHPDSISIPGRVRSKFAPTFPGLSMKRFANGSRTVAGSNDWSIKSLSRTCRPFWNGNSHS